MIRISSEHRCFLTSESMDEALLITETSLSSLVDGSSEVQLGQTRVLGFVTSQLVQPYRDRPNEGTLAIFTEFSPMADPSFEIGRPGEFAVELGRIVDRGLRESRAVDTESLCVVAGKWVWSIRIDLHVVDNGGNLVDAANIAALAALLTFRRPECTLGGDDGQEVIIHPAEVELYNTRRALKKIKRHPGSIDVTDVPKDTQKSKLKIEDKSIKQSDDTEIGNRSSKKDGNSLGDNKPKAFIGGPSSWDPYSKGIKADELKASLASRAVMTLTEKMDELPPVKRQFTTKDEAPGDAVAAHSSLVTAATCEPTNKAKTLMDAVKPKHKSRKKKLLNTDAS
ncbi:hypothetical protein ACS0TY_026838 [Phlomoides rotata]